MITDVDKGFIFFKVLVSIRFVANEIKLTEDPRPQPEKLIANPSKLSAKEKRNDNAWQQKNHETNKHG